MNWRLGAISIRSGQSGQVRELTGGPFADEQVETWFPPREQAGGERRSRGPSSRHGEPLLHEPGQRADERGIVVQRLDPLELEPEPGRALAGLDVQVPPDLEMVGDEPDGRDQ